MTKFITQRILAPSPLVYSTVRYIALDSAGPRCARYWSTGTQERTVGPSVGQLVYSSSALYKLTNHGNDRETVQENKDQVEIALFSILLEHLLLQIIINNRM